MTSDNTSVLEIDNLNVSYWTRAGEIPAVIDFNLTLMPGETIGLVGESGCGKSTVAMAIMQYMGANGTINSGSIRFKGRDLTQMSSGELRALRGSQMAMIYQEPFAALNPSLTLGQQLMEVPLAHEDISRDEAFERAVQMLDDVHLQDPRRVMNSYPHQVSGGQQQRVVIAMGLLSNPSLLLLDEPTTALDVTVEAGIVKLIAEISERFGTSQIYISHNLGLILETCSKVCVMYSGEVVEDGPIDSLFTRPRHPYTHGLFDCIPLPSADKNKAPLKPIAGQLPLPHERPPGCNFGPRCAHFEAARCDARKIAMEAVTGTDAHDPARQEHHVRCLRWSELDHDIAVDDTPSVTPIEIGEPVLRVDALQKYYQVRSNSLAALFSAGKVRQIKANEAISFDARRGETVAIVGESGCGKSTFAKVLMGLETATGGHIVHDGNEIADLDVRDRDAGQIRSLQMVFQNPSDTLNPSHTIGAQIGRVIRKFGVESNKHKIRERVMQLLDVVQLPRDFYSHRPRQLSGGQKQRVGIARAFAGNPSVVIADEPVSALDVSVAAAVTQLLMQIQRENHSTLLFISHDLSIVRYLADRVVVMYLGQVMERGTTGEIFSPPYHPYTEALLSAVPIADAKISKRKIVLEGELPSAMDPPQGCPFVTRCPRKLGPICETERPPARSAEQTHHIACHIPRIELAAVEPVFQVRAAK